MTKEEIKALLQTAEGVQVLKEITDGLAGNRDLILGEKKKLQDSLQAINTKLGELESEGEKLRGENFNLTVDRQIDKLLDETKIVPQHRRAVRALLKAEPLTIQEKDGEKQVLIGTGEKIQPLEKWVADWSLTDEGKAYVAAPANSGGGAGGSRESGLTGFNLEGADPDEILKNLDKIKKR